MPDEKKEEQFEVVETVEKEITAPTEPPAMPKRQPILRYNAIPLAEEHGMTTEANRFVEN
jgi:hypothetical protein